MKYVDRKFSVGKANSKEYVSNWEATFGKKEEAQPWTPADPKSKPLEAVVEAGRRAEAELAKSSRRKGPEPRYDEVYEKGTEWLDSLGDPEPLPSDEQIYLAELGAWAVGKMLSEEDPPPLACSPDCGCHNHQACGDDCPCAEVCSEDE